MRWFLVVCLLAACNPPSSVPPRGSAKQTPEPRDFLFTEKSVIVLCSPPEAREPSDDAPEFNVETGPGLRNFSFTMLRVGGAWCTWSDNMWSGPIHITPANKAAAYIPTLSLWYAPSGADIQQVLQVEARAILFSSFGQYLFTSMATSDPIIVINTHDQTLWRADK